MNQYRTRPGSVGEGFQWRWGRSIEPVGKRTEKKVSEQAKPQIWHILDVHWRTQREAPYRHLRRPTLLPLCGEEWGAECAEWAHWTGKEQISFEISSPSFAQAMSAMSVPQDALRSNSNANTYGQNGQNSVVLHGRGTNVDCEKFERPPLSLSLSARFSLACAAEHTRLWHTKAPTSLVFAAHPLFGVVLSIALIESPPPSQ